MADGARYSRALILGASVVSIAALVTESGLAQTAQPQAESVSPERPKQAKTVATGCDGKDGSPGRRVEHSTA